MESYLTCFPASWQTGVSRFQWLGTPPAASQIDFYFILSVIRPIQWNIYSYELMQIISAINVYADDCTSSQTYLRKHIQDAVESDNRLVKDRKDQSNSDHAKMMSRSKEDVKQLLTNLRF